MKQLMTLTNGNWDVSASDSGPRLVNERATDAGASRGRWGDGRQRAMDMEKR